MYPPHSVQKSVLDNRPPQGFWASQQKNGRREWGIKQTHWQPQNKLTVVRLEPASTQTGSRCLTRKGQVRPRSYRMCFTRQGLLTGSSLGMSRNVPTHMTPGTASSTCTIRVHLVNGAQAEPAIAEPGPGKAPNLDMHGFRQDFDASKRQTERLDCNLRLWLSQRQALRTLRAKQLHMPGMSQNWGTPSQGEKGILHTLSDDHCLAMACKALPSPRP